MAWREDGGGGLRNVADHGIVQQEAEDGQQRPYYYNWVVLVAVSSSAGIKVGELNIESAPRLGMLALLGCINNGRPASPSLDDCQFFYHAKPKISKTLHIESIWTHYLLAILLFDLPHPQRIKH
jgi:hypothetical protein